MPEASKFISIEAACESIEASTSRLHESEHSAVFGKYEYARASDISAEDEDQQRQEEQQEEDLNAMNAQEIEDSEESDEVSDEELQVSKTYSICLMILQFF